MKTKRLLAVLAAGGLLGAGALATVGWASDKALSLLADPAAAELLAADAAGGTQPALSGQGGAGQPGLSGADDASLPDQAATDAEHTAVPDKKAGADDSAGKQPAADVKPDGSGGGLSMEEAAQAGKKLSLSEKAEVLRILTGSLGSKEITALKELAKGGLSSGEKQEVKELLLEQLSPGDYNRLSALAYKAGAGGGGTYEESKR